MENHKFEYAETIDGRKVYIVKCKKTGGEFSTTHWYKLLIPQNLCPCCKEMIKEGIKRK